MTKDTNPTPEDQENPVNEERQTLIISETELLGLMEQHGFKEFVYDWNPEQEVYAIGVESHSVLFFPRFNRVAIWHNSRPYRVQPGSSQEWVALDETHLQYRKIDVAWWNRFEPVFLEIMSRFPQTDLLPAGFLKWIHAYRNVRWCNGIKVKRISPPTVNHSSALPADAVVNHSQQTDQNRGSVFKSAWSPAADEATATPMTVEKQIRAFLNRHQVAHKWRDSTGEHIIYFIGCVLTFDLSNELIQYESRASNRHQLTHGWHDWLSFNEDGIRGRFISPKRWREIKPVIEAVVSLLCGVPA